MAKFTKGNKAGKGGNRDGAGRPTKKQAAAKKTIAEKVQEYLEKNIDPVLKTYKNNAVGHWEKRFTDAGKEYEVWIVDTASTRHWIDKFAPAAKQSLEISGGIKIVKVNAFDPDSESK